MRDCLNKSKFIKENDVVQRGGNNNFCLPSCTCICTDFTLATPLCKGSRGNKALE